MGSLARRWPGAILTLHSRSQVMNAGNLVDMRRGIHDVASHPERFRGIRDRETQITSIFLFVPSTYPLFKCEAAPEQKNPEKEGKAKSLHDDLPRGKVISRRVSQRVTFLPSFSCSLVPNFVSCFQSIWYSFAKWQCCWRVKINCQVYCYTHSMELGLQWGFSFQVFFIKLEKGVLNTANRLQG